MFKYSYAGGNTLEGGMSTEKAWCVKYTGETKEEIQTPGKELQTE